VRLAHLAPTSILGDVIGDQMTHLCLANLLLEDRTYLRFYHQQVRKGAHVIMDTPAFERIQMSLDDLLEAAKQLQPTQMILPDDMDDPKVSLIRQKEAAKAIWDWKWGVDLMAVPHGHSVEEYLQNAEACAAIRGVTTIGIQEEIEEDFGIRREHMVRLIHDKLPHKRIHFNGWTETMEELEDQYCQSVVTSADSGKLVVYGLNELEPRPTQFEDFPDYPGRKSLSETSMGYFNWHPSELDGVSLDDALACVRNNIRRWNAMAERGVVID
jgi:hypothetical protein